MQRFVFHAIPPSTFCQSHFTPVQFHNVVCALIVRLLKSGRPHAITRGVSVPVIQSFKGHSAWRLSHVFKKSREVVPPFVAHRNSASTIDFVSRIVLVVASTFRMKPCSPFFCIGHSMCLIATGCQFSRKTTATKGSVFSQALRIASRKFSTITFAQPASFPLSTLGDPNSIVSLNR